MTTVVKRGGVTEEFDRKKIEDSLRSIGVDWLKSKDLAERIKEKDGISTSEIRLNIDKELKKIDPELSARYTNTRRFTAKEHEKIKKGVARLSKDSIGVLGITVGDTVEIKYRDRWQELRIEQEEGNNFHNEIKLNKKDMIAMGIIDGNRVKARKSS